LEIVFNEKGEERGKQKRPGVHWPGRFMKTMLVSYSTSSTIAPENPAATTNGEEENVLHVCNNQIPKK
jgi:hypothetical protein